MANYNKVVLMGNLTRDPELRFGPSGRAIAKLSLALNRRYRGSDNQIKDEVTYIDVTSFGRDAETLSRYLKKGNPLLVEGRLRHHKWEDEKGEKRSKVEVIAERFQFLPRQNGAAQGDPGRPFVADDEPTVIVDGEAPQEGCNCGDEHGSDPVAIPF